MKIYCTFQKTDSHDFLFRVLENFYGIPPQPLLYNENGKPYLPENPVYFSLSHSREATAVAVASSPVGLDAEYLKKQRNYAFIKNRLSAEERAEITDQTAFYKNWTAKESYVKFLGGTLGEMFSRLSFINGKLTDKGGQPPVEIRFLLKNDYLFALCRRKDISESVDFIVL